MRLASREGDNMLETALFRWFRLRKRVRQFLRFGPGSVQRVLFIVGCQRSGTSMIHHLFRLDRDAVTYDEASPLSLRDPERFRLDPLPEVRRRIMSQRAPLVVAKPLVESQNILDVLEAFPEARALWMFRDYRSVAASSLAYFGDQVGHLDLAPVLRRDAADWRSEKASAATQAAIESVYSPDLPPVDAACLFWFLRNRIYLDQGLAADGRIRLCRYEDLVAEPARIMREAYAHIGRPYPGDRIVADVFSHSRGRGRDLELVPGVGVLCDALLEEMESLPRIGKPEE
jgi:hypothetical protein